MTEATLNEDASALESPAMPTAGQCPYMGIGTAFNPLVSPHLENPYPFFARARDEEPVFFSPMLNMWVVTRYDDIAVAAKDYERFTEKGILNLMSANVSPECQALLQTSPTFSSAVAKLGSTDPPEHTRLRSVVSKAFSARRIASLAPRIRQIGEELIDQFPPGGPVDLMEQFAFRFPPSVIFDLLGIPRHDMDQIKRWCDSLAELAGSIVPPEREMACIHDVLALDQYVADLFEQHRRHPQDNLTSDCIAVVDSGEVRITEPELVSLVSFSLILGGIETTASAIGNTVQRLLTQRQQWQTLCAQPELIPQAVEETLRLYTSFLGTLRITTEDVEMRGVTIPKGTAVFLAYASANHDETYFADPETFNLHRDNLGEMLTFGRGPHYCLGAPLGRLEVQIALELLTAQFPSLRLVAGQSLSYIPSALLRGLTHLLVEWDANQTM